MFLSVSGSNVGTYPFFSSLEIFAFDVINIMRFGYEKGVWIMLKDNLKKIKYTKYYFSLFHLKCHFAKVSDCK